MVHNTKATRHTRKERQEEWRRHVEMWEESGLSKRAYCSEHELSYQRFLYWSKENATKQAEAPQLKLVKLTTSASHRDIGTVTSCDSRASYPFRVQFPKGYSIALQEQFSASSLVRLINTLESL